MAKLFTLKFIKSISNVVPSGLVIHVSSGSSKPQDNEIRKALEAAGYKVGSNVFSSSYYTIE